jgi:probable phosphoglycerate mutase
MSLEFLLIRHAQSEWNADGRWQGHADPPLSSRGLAQAAELAASLRGESVDRLVCSDLHRALATAEALAPVLGRAPRPDPRYRELDVGDWTGLRRPEIEERDSASLRRFEAGDPDLRPGGGETRREIRTRARRAVEELISEARADRIAVVTHLGFIRALVPGAEVENAEILRLGAEQILAARAVATSRITGGRSTGRTPA